MKKKPMSLFHLSVSTAQAVYHAAFITLLLGTALVLFSAIVLIWSNSVREADNAQRLAQLDAIRAQANTALLKANAELAAANRDLAQAKTATASAEKEAANAQLATGKPQVASTGREITLENRGLFLSFVKDMSKGRVVVEAIASNPESMHFARQISDMLDGAGYRVAENFGSPTLLGEPPVGVQLKIRSMEEQPIFAGSLQKGLEFIGIDTSGNLDSTAGDSVVIFVGMKP